MIQVSLNQASKPIQQLRMKEIEQCVFGLGVILTQDFLYGRVRPGVTKQTKDLQPPRLRL